MTHIDGGTAYFLKHNSDVLHEHLPPANEPFLYSDVKAEDEDDDGIPLSLFIKLRKRDIIYSDGTHVTDKGTTLQVWQVGRNVREKVAEFANQGESDE